MRPGWTLMNFGVGWTHLILLQSSSSRRYVTSPVTTSSRGPILPTDHQLHHLDLLCGAALPGAIPQHHLLPYSFLAIPQGCKGMVDWYLKGEEGTWIAVCASIVGFIFPFFFLALQPTQIWVPLAPPYFFAAWAGAFCATGVHGAGSCAASGGRHGAARLLDRTQAWLPSHPGWGPLFFASQWHHSSVLKRFLWVQFGGTMSLTSGRLNLSFQVRIFFKSPGYHGTDLPSQVCVVFLLSPFFLHH